MSYCLYNVLVVKTYSGYVADIPSEELMPYNDIPTKDQILDFWTTEGISVVTNGQELEELKKYIAWELYDYSDYPRVLKKVPNRIDEILNQNLSLNFNLNSLIVSIGAMIKNIYYSPFDNVYLVEFDRSSFCAANTYFAYKIEAISKSKRIRFLNEKPEALNEQRILNFNAFPLKKNVRKGDEEKEKQMKDYLCFLQSQNTINNINLELINEMVNQSNIRSQVQTQNEINKLSLDMINQQMSSFSSVAEKKNILEELQNELKNAFNRGEGSKGN